MAAEMPVYYELSWSILSTVGLVNTLCGIVVAGITSFSQVTLVPIITSAAGAVANGLCYYAFYAEYPTTNRVVASAFADVFWMIQEAGLSFYSYVILSRVLRSRSRYIFIALFWSIMAAILVLRLLITVHRIKYITRGSHDVQLQHIIDHLHVGYFACIALVECLSTFFLLRKFAAARSTSVQAAIKAGLFSYLMRSTEIRVALLAMVGTTRAITYSFQSTAQSATTIASQLDRFAYTLECMFPVILFIDILASKLVFANQAYEHRSGGSGRMYGARKYAKGSAVRDADAMYVGDPTTRTQTIIESVRTSSQERIMEENRLRCEEISLDNIVEVQHGGISKTVEFEVVGSAR